MLVQNAVASITLHYQLFKKKILNYKTEVTSYLPILDNANKIINAYES